MHLFMEPNNIVAGGATGISIIVSYLFQIPSFIVLYAINLPLLILCFWLLGKEVGMKTIYGSLVFPFFAWLVQDVPVLTSNLLLAAIFGGVMTGMGLGLVFKGNASTGGTAILSQIVNVYFKIPLGLSVSIVDGVVIVLALLAFDVEQVMYSLITLFIIGRVVDLVQVSFNRSKNVMIISQYPKEITEMVVERMDRGLTKFDVEGGFDQNKKTMLMCVLPEKEFHTLKEEILAIDSHAFVVVMPASEVMGRGFSLSKM
ncbi:hypothetical protein CBF29_03660 [Vagococcus elongatus]|uniref:DUF2179 domain-containing protein n=2 Tax=Vagococcus elongatus TaxID=180344 RepID=A0A430B1C6_9ENTE|nr:hypothetical protein CBF29_03660 [Vagococcus elongatus]